MVSTECRSKQPRIAVIGIGNILLRDEGVGVHVAEALQQVNIDDTVDLQIIDGGTSPDVLLSLEEVNKLIIIDAAKGNCEPGTVYRFRPDELPHKNTGFDSMHEITFSQSLQIMNQLGLKPKDVIIFGIEPKEIDWGLEPSEELKNSIPDIVKIVLEEIKRC